MRTGVSLEWAKPDGGPYLQVTDGVSLGPQWANGTLSGVGETLGPREVFTATAGYLFKVPHCRKARA
jgi:hypothetical protein